MFLKVYSAVTTSFFEKAFGKNEQEFLEILSMPKELITYRHFLRKFEYN